MTTMASCGLLLIDGSEAVLGQVGRSERHAQKVARITSSIASRTRRGGSSAGRFARKRDGAELAFLRRVVEKVLALLGHTDSLIIGGNAGMKNKLLRELPLQLRVKVLYLVNLDSSSSSGNLQKLARQFHASAAQADHADTHCCVQHFFESIEQSTDSCCYGEEETKYALTMGAVRQLLINRDLYCNNQYGESYLKLATQTRADVIAVSPISEIEHRFCQGIRIGGVLRWPVPAYDSQLDEQDSDIDECEPDADARDDTSDVSTTDDENESGPVAVLSTWLKNRLSVVLNDVASAESLAACVEVLLLYNDEPIVERIVQSVDLLREQDVPEEVLTDFSVEASFVYDMFED